MPHPFLNMPAGQLYIVFKYVIVNVEWAYNWINDTMHL